MSALLGINGFPPQLSSFQKRSHLSIAGRLAGHGWPLAALPHYPDAHPPHLCSSAEVLAPSGSAPELINGRLAMIGFVAGVGCELFTQQPILAQVRSLLSCRRWLASADPQGTCQGACQRLASAWRVAGALPERSDRLAQRLCGRHPPLCHSAPPPIVPLLPRRWAPASRPSGGPRTCLLPPPWCTCSANMRTTRPLGEPAA